MKQPIGEHVPALAIRAKLRLVERDEGEVRPARHRLHRAQRPARIGRFDPLLAGDQGHAVATLDRHDPLVDFARQQAQRKSDGARGVGAEPFDGEMGLAGIGGAKHRLHAAIAARMARGMRAGGGSRQRIGHRHHQMWHRPSLPATAGTAPFSVFDSLRAPFSAS